MIPLDLIQRTAETLMDKAAIEIPQDYLDGLQEAARTEDGDLSSFVLKAMLENYEAAKEDRRAMCGDTGVPRWFVKMGNDASVQGGMIALEAALRRATANATNGVPLRPNRVHPLWRTDHDNNVGIGAPEIEYGFEPEGQWIDLITVHKGGLFGTDYRMLFPSDGLQGIKRFYLDSLMAFGKRGLACQPAIIGIGLGGSKDVCMTLGKKASTLRVVGSRNSDPRIAEMEDEFKDLGNSIGMGAMGFVGKNMVIDCISRSDIATQAACPCQSTRSVCRPGGRWRAFMAMAGSNTGQTRVGFTPYQRRETVEWEPVQEAAE